MNTNDLQTAYVAALARVGDSPLPRAARHMPIFQRAGAPTQRQAVKDAANALRELWRGPGKKPLRKAA
jgi:hypothetical protein